MDGPRSCPGYRPIRNRVQGSRRPPHQRYCLQPVGYAPPKPLVDPHETACVVAVACPQLQPVNEGRATTTTPIDCKFMTWNRNWREGPLLESDSLEVSAPHWTIPPSGSRNERSTSCSGCRVTMCCAIAAVALASGSASDRSDRAVTVSPHTSHSTPTQAPPTPEGPGRGGRPCFRQLGRLTDGLLRDRSTFGTPPRRTSPDRTVDNRRDRRGSRPPHRGGSTVVDARLWAFLRISLRCARRPHRVARRRPTRCAPRCAPWCAPSCHRGGCAVESRWLLPLPRVSLHRARSHNRGPLTYGRTVAVGALQDHVALEEGPWEKKKLLRYVATARRRGWPHGSSRAPARGTWRLPRQDRP